MSHSWDISQNEANAARNALTQDGYNFFNDNCVDRVEDAMDASNIVHPDFDTFGVSDPKDLANWLDNLNGQDRKNNCK